MSCYNIAGVPEKGAGIFHDVLRKYMKRVYTVLYSPEQRRAILASAASAALGNRSSLLEGRHDALRMYYRFTADPSHGVQELIAIRNSILDAHPELDMKHLEVSLVLGTNFALEVRLQFCRHPTLKERQEKDLK